MEDLLLEVLEYIYLTGKECAGRMKGDKGAVKNNPAKQKNRKQDQENDIQEKGILDFVGYETEIF